MNVHSNCLYYQVSGLLFALNLSEATISVETLSASSTFLSVPEENIQPMIPPCSS